MKEIVQYPAIQGISVTNRTSPEHFPVHWHNAAEFTLALEDGCQFRIGDHRYTMSAGDLLFVWPRELHEVVHVPSQGSVFIQFSPMLLETSPDLVAAARFMNECHHIRAEKEPALADRLKEKLLYVAYLFEHRPIFTETRCRLCIQEILLMIAEHVIQEKEEALGQGLLSDIAMQHVRMACSYIAEHATDNLTQVEVADHVGLSPYYFSRIFREYVQTSFPAYLSGIRVRTAIRLLSDETLSITDCAFQAGFQSITAFNRIFHEFTGCSPREYRKLYLLPR